MANKVNSDPLYEARRQWKGRNRGFMIKLAARIGCSRSYVTDIFYGRKRSLTGDIEQALADAGAPGVKR